MEDLEHPGICVIFAVSNFKLIFMGNLISFSNGAHSVLVNTDKIIYAEELGGVKMKLVLDCGDSCQEIEVKAFVSDIMRAIKESK